MSAGEKSKWMSKAIKSGTDRGMSDAALHRAGKEHGIMAVWWMFALSVYWQGDAGARKYIWSPQALKAAPRSPQTSEWEQSMGRCCPEEPGLSSKDDCGQSTHFTQSCHTFAFLGSKKKKKTVAACWAIVSKMPVWNWTCNFQHLANFANETEWPVEIYKHVKR